MPLSLRDRLADASIFWSFDKSGFARHARHFDPADLDVRLEGRRCLVTGANSGIGKETCRELARRGAEVWMLCRSEERGRAALEELVADTGSSDLHLAVVDVSEQASIRAFVESFEPETVHVLVNNAGVLPAERRLTAEGIELTHATNTLGPFLLTALLEPHLRRAGDARVINVTSGGMYPRRLELDDVQFERRRFDGVVAYAESKRAMVVLTELWAEHFARSGVVVNSMHPGWAATPAVETSLPKFFDKMEKRLRTPAEGADTVVWLAASEACRGETGRLYFDREARKTHYLPWTRETSADRSRLWSSCAAACGLELETPSS